MGSDDRQTLAFRQQIAMEHQAYVRKELLEVQSQKRKAQARQGAQRSGSSLDETPAGSVAEADINEWIDRDPSIAQLVAKVARDEGLLTSRRLHTSEGTSPQRSSDPSLVRLSKISPPRRKSLKDKRAALRPTAIKALQEMRVTVRPQAAMGTSRSWRCSIIWSK